MRLDDTSVVAAFVPGPDSATRTATVTQRRSPSPSSRPPQAKKIKPKENISTFTTTSRTTRRARRTSSSPRGPSTAPTSRPASSSASTALGQRTAAKGYNSAPVIVNGRLTKDYGGGISQLSTTIFNAAFFSGMQIELDAAQLLHLPLPRGARGDDLLARRRQQVHQRHRLRHPHPGLASRRSAVTVTFYGTKVWDVKAVKGPRRNVVQPKKIVDDKRGASRRRRAPGST